MYFSAIALSSKRSTVSLLGISFTLATAQRRYSFLRISRIQSSRASSPSAYFYLTAAALSLIAAFSMRACVLVSGMLCSIALCMLAMLSCIVHIC